MASSDKNVRVAPNSKESEMMVLGCMLTSINSLNIAADSLDDSDFYFTEHKSVFSVLKALYRSDKPADVHIVCEELKRQDKLKAVGGVSYVTTLAQYAGTSAYIEEYVSIVRNKSLLRCMINASQVIEKKALDASEEPSIVLDEAQQLFFQISQTASTGAGKLVSEILSGTKSESQKPYLKELQERQEEYEEKGPEEAGITGLPSRFTDLDKMLNGLGNSNLIILAARPAMGKTALALNIAENVAFVNKVPVGVFSLEMSAEQLVHRVVCSRSEVESDKIRTGALDGMEYQRIVGAVNEMMGDVMIIDDQPGLTITDLRARARRMKETYDIGLIIVDYMQLLSGSGGRMGESRQMEIAEISRMLKNLARELNVPVICLSQLSRKVEERTGHRPMLSDLRESGSIEQDADIIMFLLRRDYYDPNDKPGMAELIVAKNRHGSIGSVNFTFRKEIAQFVNYIPMEYMVDPQAARESEEAFSDFSPTPSG
ncbi:Replicative DNA helicase [Chlamydiales bacterium SCGC AG-110-P3]|nr:Replicative DNA helicase [Chlamydiales bacterium SCGC AG-110-P3]